MEVIAGFALCLALALTVYALFASVTGTIRKNDRLIYSSYRAVAATWLAVTVAIGILLYSLFIDDFHLAYVAAHSNRALPWFYKITSLWSGQEGSLLFWSWLLAGYATVAVCTHEGKASLHDAPRCGDLGRGASVLPHHERIRRQRVPHVRDEPGRADGGEGPSMARPEPAAAILDDGDPSADAVPRLRRLHGAVRLRDGIADHQAARRRVDSHDSPLDHRHLDVPEYRHSSRARAGPTLCSAGAATGDGTRWRTLRCCRGSPLPLFCTP